MFARSLDVCRASVRTADASTRLISLRLLRPGPGEKVNDDHDRTLEEKAVRHAGRDRLPTTGNHLDIHGRLSIHHEPDSSFENAQTAPRRPGDGMARQQGRRKSRRDEGPGYSGHNEAVRKFGSIAQRALEVRAEAVIASGLRQHPGSIRERRLVAYMLSVEAGQLCHPVSLFILMEAGNAAKHLPIMAASESNAFNDVPRTGQYR